MPQEILKHEDGTPLQDWAGAHQPEKDMDFAGGFWNQFTYVRDRLHRLFVTDYDQNQEQPVRVVGSHTSKSIVLPVYSIKAAGLQILLRCNFGDWKVSVKSDRPVPDNFCHLINRAEQVHSVYCEGFSENWVFGPYSENPCHFTVEIGNKYDLYAFLYLLSEGLEIRPPQCQSR